MRGALEQAQRNFDKLAGGGETALLKLGRDGALRFGLEGERILARDGEPQLDRIAAYGRAIVEQQRPCFGLECLEGFGVRELRAKLLDAVHQENFGRGPKVPADLQDLRKRQHVRHAEGLLELLLGGVHTLEIAALRFDRVQEAAHVLAQRLFGPPPIEPVIALGRGSGGSTRPDGREDRAGLVKKGNRAGERLLLPRAVAAPENPVCEPKQEAYGQPKRHHRRQG